MIASMIHHGLRLNPRNKFFHFLIIGVLIHAFAFSGPPVVLGAATPAGKPRPASSKSAPKEASPEAPPQLTVESVQERLGRTERDDTLSENVKKRLVELYTQTIDKLRQADEQTARVAELEKMIQEAPAQLAALKAELAQPVAAELKLEVPPNATAATLEPLLRQQEAALADTQKKLEDLEGELQKRPARRLDVPKSIETLRKSQEEARASAKAKTSSGEPRRVTAARGLLASASDRAYDQMIAAREKELARIDATGELLTARRDQAARRHDQAEKLVKAWRDLVEKQRQLDAENAARQARRTAAEAHPAVRQLAEINQQLAEERTGPAGMTNKIADVTRLAEETGKTFKKVQAEYESVKAKDQAAGLSKTIGMLLRKQRRDLPDLRQLRQAIRQRQELIPAVNLKLLELQENRTTQADSMDEDTSAVLARLDPALSQDQLLEIEQTVRQLLKTKIELLGSLRTDYDTYFSKLGELDESQRSLAEVLDSYLKYIDERVLWIRSTQALRPDTLPEVWRAIRWLADPAEWRESGKSLTRKVRESMPLLLSIAALLVLLWVSRRRFQEKIRTLGALAEDPSCLRFAYTLQSLLYTVLASVFWPVALWLSGWLLASPLDAPELAKALGAGLQAVAMPCLVIELLRQISIEQGLAEVHFGWPGTALRVIHRRLLKLEAMGLPLLFLASVMSAQANEMHKESLGRLALMGGLVVLAASMHRMFQPQRGAFLPVLALKPGDWAARLRPIWHPVAVGIPLLLAIIAALGYSYTAQQLVGRLLPTMALTLGLLVLNELLHRWLVLNQRKLALCEVPMQPSHERDDTSPMPPDLPNLPPQPAVDLAAVNMQSSRIMKSLVGFALLIGLWMIWVDVLPALGILKRVELWSEKTKVVKTVSASDAANAPESAVTVEENVPVTLADLVLAIAILFMTGVAGSNIPGLLEVTLLQRLRLDSGVRFAITTVSRYLIVTIGIIIAFGTIHVGWGKVQWLAAAMTVGLGFGLQEIFANFVSGLIILFERPIRVGDIVTVKEISGNVTRIQMRATTITDGDRRELIVPNKEFITGQIINWTLSDPITRVVVPVSIANGSNTTLAQQLLIECARENPIVMEDPEPAAAFINFGESSLDFKLYVHIPQRSLYLTVVHELHTAIDQAFRKAGIEIAFPHRDLHLDLARPLDVRVIPDHPRSHAGQECIAPERTEHDRK